MVWVIFFIRHFSGTSSNRNFLNYLNFIVYIKKKKNCHLGSTDDRKHFIWSVIWCFLPIFPKYENPRKITLVDYSYSIDFSGRKNRRVGGLMNLFIIYRNGPSWPGLYGCYLQISGIHTPITYTPGPNLHIWPDGFHP